MYWRDYERIGASHVVGGIALTISYTGGHNLKLRSQTCRCGHLEYVFHVFLYFLSLCICVYICVYISMYYIFICSIILNIVNTHSE